MLKEAIRPTTIVGIKRLATQHKKTAGISHREALDFAARKAGYQSFDHARRMLGSNDNVTGDGHSLFLTYYWCDRKPYRAGRETIEIRLSRPLSEICDRDGLRDGRVTAGMRLVTPDHLVHDFLAESQDYARGELCKLVRSLRFMEATGLQPCSWRRAREAMSDREDELPGKDHGTEWHDPRTGHVILLDEPYSPAVVSPERAAWAARNGWHLQASSWPGIYSPFACALFVAAKADGDLDFAALMARIDGLAPPVTADAWPGISVPGHETFLSPMAITPQDKRRSRAKGTVYQVSSKTTVPSSARWNALRKPVGAFGLDTHVEAGRMIKAVLYSASKPYAVNARFETLRCTLESWLAMEAREEDMSRREFLDAYYGAFDKGDPMVVEADSSDGVIAMLSKLRAMLTEAYPDCAPLRRLTGRIDTAVKMTARYRDREEARLSAAVARTMPGRRSLH
ncbi:DUF5623 domain-containing protein [Novosphingobium mathurense]|uniref:DUF5623 domain-containing protein n=1 Tax=Novosphingobium mathurense TaxID=428990 RepID=A0A1U6IIB1_9SPHN|nr:DUF5623 domain-containing protein [Novosphingobium mathurense]SLK07761.1 hypothetical protein SAMN06295987_10744 [Novosphingobium mathurense]